MEKMITIFIDRKNYDFEKNEEKSVSELLAIVNTNTTKSELRFKRNNQQKSWQKLGDEEIIKLKDGMLFKSFPKTITDGIN